MVDKQKVDEQVEDADDSKDSKDAKDPKDEAYEDSWYRSLKALSERRPVPSDEEVEGPED